MFLRKKLEKKDSKVKAKMIKNIISAILKHPAFRIYFPIFLIIILGTFLSISTFHIVSKLEAHEIKLDFLRAAENRASAIKNSFELRMLVLKSIRAFYENSHEIERLEFKRFAATFLNQYPDIQALEWVPHVIHAQRKKFEEDAVSDGFTDFKFTERKQQGVMARAADRDEYFPVYFVEPARGNELALGFDLASNPARLDALNLSRQTGKLVASARITLVQEKSNEFGMLMFVPIYRQRESLFSSEKRGFKFLGFGLGVFRIANLVEDTFVDLKPQGIDVFLYDESTTDDESFLFHHVSRTRRNKSLNKKKPQRGFLKSHDSSEMKYEMTFDVGGRKLLVLCVPAPMFISSRKTLYPAALLIGGLFFTVLIALYVYFILNRNQHIKLLVDKRTSELNESERRWQFALEGSGDGIWDWNVLTNKVYFSKQWKKMLGFEEHEIKNDLNEWRGRVHPDDIEYVTEGMQKHFKKETPVYVSEYRALCKDGTYKWILDRGKVLTWAKDGRPLRMIGTHSDITDRVNSMLEIQKLSTAVEQSPSVVVITNLKGDIEYVNPKFVQLTGYSFDEVKGKNLRILKSEKATSEFYEDLWSTISGGQEWSGEFYNKKKNGENYWELASISPIRNNKGVMTNFVKVSENITLRKESEEKIKEALRMKSDFTSMVSHELRTPLTAIKEGIWIVLDGSCGDINEEQSGYLAAAKRNVDRLAKLIDDVLDIQKLEAEVMPFEMQESDINVLLNVVYYTMLPVVNEKELQLEIKIDKGLPRVKCDEDKIMQVLTNLLDNAIKFTEKGCITIGGEVDGDFVKVFISDTGPGIGEDDMGKIFGKFEQLSGERKRKTGGTGLGLAISKEIIEKHKGKIWAESISGEGTSFYFTLPVMDESD